MGFAGTMLALSAVQGITAIGQGNAQAAESNYNASLASDQAAILQNNAAAIQTEGNIEQGQIARKGGQLQAKATATAGSEGLEPTGSVAATMLDAQTQIQTDMAISQFNTAMNETNNQTAVFNANSQATNLREQATMEEYSGYSTAFNDVLSGATKAYAYTHKINTN